MPSREGEPRLTSRDDRLEVAWAAAEGCEEAPHDMAEAGAPIELSVLLPFAARATADTGRLTFYPATDPTARIPTAKLARWSIPQGAHATLTLSAPRPEPPAAINDVIVRIHASGFVPTEMEWPSRIWPSWSCSR